MHSVNKCSVESASRHLVHSVNRHSVEYRRCWLSNLRSEYLIQKQICCLARIVTCISVITTRTLRLLICKPHCLHHALEQSHMPCCYGTSLNYCHPYTVHCRGALYITRHATEALMGAMVALTLETCSGHFPCWRGTQQWDRRESSKSAEKYQCIQLSFVFANSHNKITEINQ